MQYRVCPHCGASLDPVEQCDCQTKREGAPEAPETPSKSGGIATSISVSNWKPDVNACLKLRQIVTQTGARGRELASVVQDMFRSFNRQLLTQCQSPEKYGIIIHPDALAIICTAYGVMPAASVESQTPVITALGPRKRPNRKLSRKLTFRMKNEDYALLERCVREAGYPSSQAWLYDVVMKALRGEAAHDG